MKAGDEFTCSPDLHQSVAYAAGDGELREHYAPLVKHIEELHNLYKVLGAPAKKRGGISFESEEAKFIFNAERRIERIEQTQRNDAHKLIEECMIRRTSPPRASLRGAGARRYSVSMIKPTTRSDYLLPYRAG